MKVRPREAADRAAARAFLARYLSARVARLGQLLDPLEYPALRTDVGKHLAQAITSADPHGWWSAFAASYHELRASTRARDRGQVSPRPNS